MLFYAAIFLGGLPLCMLLFEQVESSIKLPLVR